MGVIAGISTINQGQLSAAEDAPPIAQDLWKRITKCGNQYKYMRSFCTSICSSYHALTVCLYRLKEIVPGCYITSKSTFTLPAEFRETVNAFFSSRNIPDIQADEKVGVSARYS